MFLTLRIPWILIDVADGFRPVLVPPGRYPASVMENPNNPDGEDWIVLENSQIGLSRSTAYEMSSCHFGDFQIQIEEPAAWQPASEPVP